MLRVFRDYLYTFIGLVVAIATLYEFFNSLFPNLSKDARLAVGLIVLLFLWFFIENLYIKVKWGRERKYAETLSNITG